MEYRGKRMDDLVGFPGLGWVIWVGKGDGVLK